MSSKRSNTTCVNFALFVQFTALSPKCYPIVIEMIPNSVTVRFTRPPMVLDLFRSILLGLCYYYMLSYVFSSKNLTLFINLLIPEYWC